MTNAGSLKYISYQSAALGQINFDPIADSDGMFTLPALNTQSDIKATGSGKGVRVLQPSLGKFKCDVAMEQGITLEQIANITQETGTFTIASYANVTYQCGVATITGTTEGNAGKGTVSITIECETMKVI